MRRKACFGAASFFVILSSMAASNQSRLTITIQQVQSSDPTKAGQVEIRATVKNISEADVLVDQERPSSDNYQIDVVGPDRKGTHASASASTRAARRAAWAPETLGRSGVVITLQRQQTISDTLKISELVDMLRPGRYEIKVTRNFKAINETAASNTITVTVP